MKRYKRHHICTKYGEKKYQISDEESEKKTDFGLYKLKKLEKKKEEIKVRHGRVQGGRDAEGEGATEVLQIGHQFLSLNH